MPDQRSAMKEFRFLDEKRAAEGLSAAEEARYAQLRDLFGPEIGAGGLKPQRGFDVNAAAARLRESLLPAGLRNRPPPPPELAEPAPEPEPVAEPAPEPATAEEALAAAWNEQPFASLDPATGEVADPYFDPATLDAPAEPTPFADASTAGAAPAAETAWEASEGGVTEAGAEGDWAAAGGDPAAYGEVAYAGTEGQGAAAWDPNDPNAAAFDPSTAAYDPNAWAADGTPVDPNAAPAWDPNDPNAAAYDPSTAAYDPNAWAADGTPVDPNAAPAWDPNHTDAAEGLASELGASPAGEAEAWAGSPAPEGARADAAAEAGYDEVAWDAAPGLAEDPGAEASTDAAGYPAPPAADAGWDAAGEPVPATAPEAVETAEADANPYAVAAHALPESPAEGWDLAPPSPEAPALPTGEYDEAGASPAGLAALESLLPFDPAADAAIEPGALPDGFGPPELGEYDDTAAFGASGEPPPGDLPVDAPGFRAGVPVPAAGEWQPETALEQGFELASGGSFDAAAQAVADDAGEGEAGPAEALAPADGLEALGEEPIPLDDAGLEPVAEVLPEEAAPDAAEDALAAPADAPWDGGDLAGPDLDAAAAEALAAGPAPELDFSAPELSTEGELDGVADVPYALAAPGAPEPGAAPDDVAPLDLGALDPEPAEAPPSARRAIPQLALEDEPEPPAAAAPDLVEEIPTIDGEEILEEIPLDEAEPPAEALAFDPLPSHDAFEGSFTAPDATPELGSHPEAAAELASHPEPAPDSPLDLAEAPEAAFDAGPADPALEAAPADDLFAGTTEPALADDLAPPPPEPEAAAPAEPEPAAPAEAADAPPPPDAGHLDDLAYVEAELAAAAARAAGPAAPPPEPGGVVELSALQADAPEEAPEAAPPAAVSYVPGTHRVVVHTVEGQVRRGVLEDADLAAAALGLAAQPGAAPDALPTDHVKAIFFMLDPGEKAPTPGGKKVRVTFRDGRQVAGFSPDYQEGGVGFFMIPADTRTNTARIWVYQAAVRTVAVS